MAEVRGSSKTIEDLPDEILSYIFSYIPGFILLHEVMNVCQKWRTLVKEDKCLWRNKWGVFVSDDVKDFNFANMTAIRFVCRSSKQCLAFIAKLNEDNCKIKKIEIHLSQPYLIDDVLEEIARSSTFEHLEHLGFCATLWNNQNIMTRLPKLKVLIIADGYCLHGNIFRRIIDGCTAVSTLHMGGSGYLRDPDVRYMKTKFVNTLVDLQLDGLSLSSYAWLSDFGNLEWLRIDFARCWNKNSFLSLANLKKLKYVSLNQCKLDKKEICKVLPFPYSSTTIILEDVICLELSAQIFEENHMTININSSKPFSTVDTLSSLFQEFYGRDQWHCCGIPSLPMKPKPMKQTLFTPKCAVKPLRAP